jgi:hypothetical protein
MIRSFIAFLSGSLCYAALLLRVEMPNGRYRGQNPTAARAALMILSERPMFLFMLSSYRSKIVGQG